MDEYTKDLYTMMFSLQTLQNQGITIRETVYKSLDKLLLWNKESENSKYLELALLHMQAYANIPSLTVAEIKNRCIPCVYWGTAIFVVVMKYSNLFFSFAFFLDRSHFAFGYELIISSEAAGFMKIICNGFTLI